MCIQMGGRDLIREIIETLKKSDNVAERERGGDFYCTGKRDHGNVREKEIYRTGDR